MEKRQIRILVVDHNPLLREGLSLLIHSEPDMELVGAVASGEEAVQWFTQHRPDVTLMDLDLPSGSGITAILKILQIDPGTCVLGSCTYDWDESSVQALQRRNRTSGLRLRNIWPKRYLTASDLSNVGRAVKVYWVTKRKK